MRRRWLTRLIAPAALAAALCHPAAAAEFDDPNWPCIQRKIDQLSAAQMWPGPPPEGAAADTAAVERLARSIAPRRVTAEEATAAAAGLVDGLDAEARADELGRLFDAVLARINAERGQLIAGIGRYARRQARLAEVVEAKQLELAEFETAPEAERNRERMEELRATLIWDTRVFRERAQALIYVCETPLLLERRAFELGRALSGLI